MKFGFLLVLYLFLLWVARSALRDLSRGVEAVGGTGAAAPAPDYRPQDDQIQIPVENQ